MIGRLLNLVKKRINLIEKGLAYDEFYKEHAELTANAYSLANSLEYNEITMGWVKKTQQIIDSPEMEVDASEIGR